MISAAVGSRTFAYIQSSVDGATIGATDATGRLEFFTTPDGSGTSIERIRIDNAGVVYVGNGATAAAPNAGIISATGGSGAVAGAALTIRSGAGGSTLASGAITVTSGATTDGNTGSATLASSAATGTNRSTGDVNITCGTPTGSGTRGNIVTTGNLRTATAGTYDIGQASTGWKRLYLDSGIDTTAGDTATINKATGRFRKDTTGTTFTLTNSYITANSIVLLTFVSADATATSMAVAAAAGSCVVTFNAAPTANCDVNFLVVNTD